MGKFWGEKKEKKKKKNPDPRVRKVLDKKTFCDSLTL